MPVFWRTLIIAFVSGAAVFILVFWEISGTSLAFIERYFGLAPDRGNGSVEVLLLLTLIGITAGLALHLPTKLKAFDSD